MSKSLHPSLERYFKDKDAPSTSNPPLFFKQLNAHLRKKLRLGKEIDTACVKTTKRVYPKYFLIKRDNCEQAISASAWSNLKHDEKARTTFFLLEKLSKEISPNTYTPLLGFVPSIKQAEMSCNAMFTQFQNGEKNHIYINPEFFDHTHGINIANTLAHELQHNHDFAEYRERIIPELIRKYVSPAAYNQTWSLMNLPIRGQIYNNDTQHLEEITPELSEQILSAKYFYGGFTGKSKHNNISQIYSHEDTLAYIHYYAYRTCPLERRAFARGYSCAKNIVDQNEAHDIVSELDNSALRGIKKSLDNTDRQISLLETLTGLKPEDIYEMFCKLSYLESNRLKFDFADHEIRMIQSELRDLAEHAYSKMQHIRSKDDFQP